MLGLPTKVEEVLNEFRTCELSTMAKNGTPITWPVVSVYLEEKNRFYMTTSIGYPHKTFNIRRNPQVSMLFSDPTGSGLNEPPAVLVQGLANAPDEVFTQADDATALFLKTAPRQPAGKQYSGNLIARYLFDWYYMRLGIYVTPKKIMWWERGDFSRQPQTVEVTHVG